MGEKTSRPLSRRFCSRKFEITKNFYNHDDGENDKESGYLTKILVTATRRDSRQYNLEMIDF